MSRSLNVFEESPALGAIDRAALMLDEGRVFNQWWLDEEEGGGPSGTSWVGQFLYDQAGNPLGTLTASAPLSPSQRRLPWAKPALYIQGSGGSNDIMRFQPGVYMVDAGMGKRWHVGLDAQGMGVKSGSSTAPTGSTSTGSYGSSRAGAAAQEAAAMARLVTQLRAEEAEARRNRDWQTAERLAGEAAAAEAAQLAAENQLKLSRLGEAGAMARTFETVKGQARDLIAELYGKDYLRGAVRATGAVPRGTTPHEAFMGELGAVVDRPTPVVSGESTLPQIESIIASMRGGQRLPSLPPFISGRAGGGSVAPGEMVKVGELGEEYVYNPGDGNVEVLTLDQARGLGADVVGSAQEGGRFQFDKSSIGQLLEPAYERLGFGGPVTTRETTTGTRAFTGKGLGTYPQLFNRLGLNPRLVEASETGRIYYLQDGTRRPIGSREFDELGFKRSDVISMPWREVANLAPTAGSLLTEAPAMEAFEGGYPAPAIASRLPEELGGYVLPDPSQIANLYRLFDPSNRAMLLSAWGLTNMSEEQALGRVGAYTPTGTAGFVGYG